MKELTLDELIEQAEKLQKKPTRKVSSSSVDNFISRQGIAAGTNRVPSYVIFYYYKRIWGDRYCNNFVSKIQFFRVFNKSFSQVRTGRQRYYLLNDALDISPEILEKAKKYDIKISKHIRRDYDRKEAK